MPLFAAGRRTCWRQRSRPAGARMTAIEARTPVLDPEEARRARNERLERVGKWVLPILIMAVAVWFWDRIVVWNEIPKYILPRPGLVAETLWNDRGLLFGA